MEQRQHAHLLWMVKRREHAGWFVDELCQLLFLSAQRAGQISFDLTIAITGEYSQSATAPKDAPCSGKDVVADKHAAVERRLVHGRPDMSRYFRAIDERYSKLDAAVSVCGPRVLIWSVRLAVAKWSGRNVLFDVEEEAFEF